MNHLLLDQLSTEVLLHIFKYLDFRELVKVRMICRRFKEIIDTWIQTLLDEPEPLVTNQAHPIIIQRSRRMLSHYAKFRISKNWKQGIYEETSYFGNRNRKKYMPHLQLEKDVLWLSRGNELKAYGRTARGINPRYVKYSVRDRRREINSFVVNDDVVLVAETEGGIFMRSLKTKSTIFEQGPLENNEGGIHCADLCKDLVVTGSRRGYINLYRWTMDEGVVSKHKNSVFDFVWSTALCPDAPLLAIGTAARNDQFNIKLMDTNLYEESPSSTGIRTLQKCHYASGVLCLKWESPSLLWSSEHNGTLKRWDLRTNRVEQSYRDPNAASIYCFQYDHVNTVITGTQHYGRAVLWDTRQQKDYVQMYFMECCKKRMGSSPIYSLSFDPEYLFTATDENLNVFNFSVFGGQPRDYSNLGFT